MKPMILFIVVHPIVSAFKQQPQDSCPFRSRVDPKTNMIAYIPDGCRYEVTMGQYLRMMAQIRSRKQYAYLLQLRQHNR
jgi:hypothetical protein